MVEIPQSLTKIDPQNYSTQSETIGKKGTEFRLKGKQTLHFCILVQMDGSKGWVEFNVKSQHGGKDKKRVNIKLSD